MIPLGVEGLVSGALAAGYFCVGLFFLRFWTRTRDRLFLAFAGAFGLIAVGQVLPVLLGLREETRSNAYLLRLAAFALIIAAILAKNLRSRRRR